MVESRTSRIKCRDIREGELDRSHAAFVRDRTWRSTRDLGTVLNVRHELPGDGSVPLSLNACNGPGLPCPRHPVWSMVQPKIPRDTTLLSSGPEHDGRAQ